MMFFFQIISLTLWLYERKKYGLRLRAKYVVLQPLLNRISRFDEGNSRHVFGPDRRQKVVDSDVTIHDLTKQIYKRKR